MLDVFLQAAMLIRVIGLFLVTLAFVGFAAVLRSLAVRKKLAHFFPRTKFCFFTSFIVLGAAAYVFSGLLYFAGLFFQLPAEEWEFWSLFARVIVLVGSLSVFYGLFKFYRIGIAEKPKCR